MSEKIRERVFGSVFTMLAALLSFLAYSFTSTFITEAKVKEIISQERESRNAVLSEINTKLSLIQQVICFRDKEACNALKK